MIPPSEKNLISIDFCLPDPESIPDPEPEQDFQR